MATRATLPSLTVARITTPGSILSLIRSAASRSRSLLAASMLPTTRLIPSIFSAWASRLLCSFNRLAAALCLQFFFQLTSSVDNLFNFDGQILRLCFQHASYIVNQLILFTHRLPGCQSGGAFNSSDPGSNTAFGCQSEKTSFR